MELVVFSHGADGCGLEPHAMIEAVAARLGDAPWTAAYIPDRSLAFLPALRRLVHAEPVAGPPSHLNDLIADHAGGRVFAVSGPQAVRKLAAEIYDVDLGVVPLPESGSLTRFRISRTGVRSVICLNDTLHLAVAAADALPREDVHIS
ncbi:hypothetical protein [Nocardia veterana]|uniref:Uncharacterized protein n=1 Tax=Nocardia veterana TaxID=132249 RepID=A0A7X6M024_9NOCA|nr:hypothetical protein [Nocardia veterana]NKY87731.1 hypothetical protein [Nocardia veterana]